MKNIFRKHFVDFLSFPIYTGPVLLVPFVVYHLYSQGINLSSPPLTVLYEVLLSTVGSILVLIVITSPSWFVLRGDSEVRDDIRKRYSSQVKVRRYWGKILFEGSRFFFRIYSMDFIYRRADY